MAVVPHNTRSELPSVRLPRVSTPTPRLAEAMSAQTAAIGRRAGAIGDLARTHGQMADAIGRQARARAGIIDAKWKGRTAAFDALEKLGHQTMQAGFELDRIAQRRAAREADAALAEDKLAAMTAWKGHVDENGNEVAGISQTPHSPGNENEDADGPAIRMAKYLRDMKEDADGNYSKLSPKAKEHYDRNLHTLTIPIMASAMDQEYKQVQAYRQQVNQRAYTADRSIGREAATKMTTPDGKTAWEGTIAALVNQGIMRELGHLQENPDNMEITKAKWTSPKVAEEAAAMQDALVMTYYADAVEALIAEANNESDDATRETLLATARGLSESKGADGEPVLDQKERSTYIDKMERVRHAANQKQASLREFLSRQATEYATNLMLAPEDDKADEWQQGLADILPQLSPTKRNNIQRSIESNMSAIDDARYTDAFNRYLLSPTPENEEAVTLAIAGMNMPSSQQKAMLNWQNYQQGRFQAAAKEEQKAVTDAMHVAIAAGRDLTAPGYPVVPSHELIRMANNATTAYQLPSDQRNKMMDAIRKRVPADDALFAEACEVLGEIIGQESLNEMFAMAKGTVTYSPSYHRHRPVSPEATVGYVEDEFTLSRPARWYERMVGTKGIVEKKRKRMAVEAEVAQRLLQVAMEYQKMDHTPAPDGTPPPSLRELMHDALTANKELSTQLRMRDMDAHYGYMQGHINAVTNAMEYQRFLYDLQYARPDREE